LLVVWLALSASVVRAADFVAASPDEPLAKQFSALAAAEALDASALVWQQENECSQCHANMMYLIARPALADVKPAPPDVRQLYDSLVTGRWKEHGLRYPAEATWVAVPLVLNDARTSGRLSPAAQGALERMLSLQRDDGSWAAVYGAPKAFIRDLEHVLYAGIAIAQAPDDFAARTSTRDALPAGARTVGCAAR
jgi:hypothetical protein